MKKNTLLIIVLGILAFMACSENEDPNTYDGQIIPLEIGNSWKYRTLGYTPDGNPDSIDISYEYGKYITDTLSFNDTLCYVMEYTMDDTTLPVMRHDIISRIGDHIYRLAIIDRHDTIRFDIPETIVKYPVSFGEKIFSDTLHNIHGDVDSLYWLVTDLNTNIHTDAGSFNCVEYYSHYFWYSDSAGVIDSTLHELRHYFAPDIGFIRLDNFVDHRLRYRDELIEIIIN